MRLLCILLGLAILLNSNFAYAVDPERCRSLLEKSLIEFYLPSVDEQHGGYLEVLNQDNRFSESDKFLTLQARQLWFFSTLAVNDIHRQESLRAAKSGYEFLIDHFYDPQHGGYYAKTSVSGVAVDTRKHVYPNAFVIYGMVAYYRATQDNSVLERAVALFETLEKHCYDPQHGGYNEFFYADWRLITDPSEAGYVGAINTKTYNSHLHLLEAFAQLYRATQNELVGRRLAELIDINTTTVRHPDHPCNIDGWTPDWRMIDSDRNLRASYGHDVECAWLVLDACQALNRSPKPLLSWAEGLCANAIEFGFDAQHGGFYSSGPVTGPSDDRRKVWWTQTEALVAMLTLEKMPGDSRYRQIFEDCFAFVEKHQIASEGGWWDTVNEDGSVGNKKVRTSMWQGAYHNGRALVMCARLLNELDSR